MIEIMNFPPPFDKLPENACHYFSLKKGEFAFLQDDPARGPFYVRSGGVELNRHTQAGNRVVLHRASANETFAEASLFSDHYHCDGVATIDSKLVRFDRAVLLARLKEDGVFANQLLNRFATQVQGYRRHLELLAIRGANERVLAALSDGLHTGTVMAFSAAIGLTHEATYRALSQLVKSGKIKRVSRGRYKLLISGR